MGIPSVVSSSSLQGGNHQRWSSLDENLARIEIGITKTEIYSDNEVPRGKETELPAAVKSENDKVKDDNVYPSPLGLVILIAGIALSVFLISLDRTIITTVSSSSIHGFEYSEN